MNWPFSRDFMLQRMLEADATYDGNFITGVVSTGIYCLPSCRARKPKPENVVFYASPAAARTGGLRACQRCKPDDFYLGTDAQEQELELALARLDLSEVRNMSALAKHVGVGYSKLHQLFRDYLHATPAEWSTKRRVRAARELLLTTPHAAAQIAFLVGFESLSAFGQQFRRWSAMTPQAFRLLAVGEPFDLKLPRGYPAAEMLSALGRDRQQTTARVEGPRYSSVLHLPSGNVLLRLHFQTERVRGEALSSFALTAEDTLALHDMLLRLLGAQTDPARFEHHVLAASSLAPLIEGRSGLRVPLVADLFDGLVWAMLGQQISFKATCLFRRRLTEHISHPHAEELYAPPSPQAVASLSVCELQAVGLTKARAEGLRRVAGIVVSGHLDLHQLALGTASRAERTLLALPGVGPWTAHYILLRVLGFQDAAPLGDSALQTELQHFFSLPQRPNARQAQRLMAQFAPHRSLATLHFWRRFSSRTAEENL